MLIEVNEPEYCKLVVHYEAGADQIDNKRAEVLTHFKKAPVPGCRAGKASLEAIRIYYHSQIEDSLKRALAEEAYHNVIFDKEIKPLGTPDFTKIDLAKNKFSCDFTLNKKPGFELAEYKGFEIPKPVAKDPVLLAEKMIQDLRIQHGVSVPYGVDDFVQTGDNVVLDYAAFDGDTAIDFLTAQGELLTVGHSQLPAFDDALLGMKASESRTFTIPVSAEISSAMAGKILRFDVTVHTGSKVEPMPIDNDLAVKVGKKDVHELLQHAAGQASARSTELVRSETLKQVSARLVSSNEFEVPSWLTLSEAKYLTANSKLAWDTLSDDTRQVYLALAETNVKLGLILDKIRDNEPDAQLSDQEVIDIVKRNINNSDANPDVVLQAMSKNGYLPILVARIRDEHTLDFVLKNSKIVD